MKPLLSELFLPCSGKHSPMRANRCPLTTITGAQRASGQTHLRARSHQDGADLRADRSTAYLVSCIRVCSAHGNSLVMQFLTPDMIGRIASALGLDRTNTQTAIGAAVPGLLAGLSGVAAQPGGAQKLVDAVRQQTSALGSFAKMVGASGQSSLIEKGSQIDRKSTRLNSSH